MKIRYTKFTFENPVRIGTPWKTTYHLFINHNHQFSLCFFSFSSVELLSCVWLFATPWTAAPQLPCPSPTPGACSNSCPSSQWCHPTISSSLIPFSSHLQSFPESGFFPMSQLFASGGQSIRVSASSSALPMDSQDWFPVGWTGWISLQSKELSRVFSNTTVQKHQYFGTQLSFRPLLQAANRKRVVLDPFLE